MLYVRTPKGFFPLDDTGLIYGGTQASTEVSFSAMYDLQQKAEAVVRADPAVVNVGSSIGTTGWNASVNRGNLFISLKPLAERGGITSQAVANRLRQKTADIPGQFQKPFSLNLLRQSCVPTRRTQIRCPSTTFWTASSRRMSRRCRRRRRSARRKIRVPKRFCE